MNPYKTVREIRSVSAKINTLAYNYFNEVEPSLIIKLNEAIAMLEELAIKVEKQADQEFEGGAMKVIYHKTLIEKIIDERDKAIEDNKFIEKIILTKSEAIELWNNCPEKFNPPIKTGDYIFGLLIEVENDR